MMDQATEQKLAQFIDICSNNDFETSPSEYSLAITLLKEIYTDGFRHEYSKIARMLSHPSSGIHTPDQFIYLRDNLSFIENDFQATGLTVQQQESFRKLSDHIRLEAYRIENVDSRLDSMTRELEKQKAALDLLGKDGANVQKLLRVTEAVLSMSNEAQKKQKEQEQAFEEIKAKIDESQAVEKELSAKLKSTQEKLSSFDTHSVTILSIFSAIVFAFTGGFTMLGSAFSNLAGITRNESILLITLVLIVGCILVDIIYFLLHFIGRIAGIHVGGGCTLKCDECSSKADGKTTCNLWTRLTKRHPIVFCANIVMLVVVVALFVTNLFGITPDFPEKTVNEPTSACVEITVMPIGKEESTPTPISTVQPSPTTAQSRTTNTPFATNEPSK